MDKKKWIEDNQWFIDAIADETPVLFSDDGVHWKEKIPAGFSLTLLAFYEAETNLYFLHAKPVES